MYYMLLVILNYVSYLNTPKYKLDDAINTLYYGHECQKAYWPSYKYPYSL